MFAIYDGHGGTECCNFMKENMHSYILSQYEPKNFQNMIRNSCKNMDIDFLNKARKEFYCDTSGSCALGLLSIGNGNCFINIR